LIIGVVASLAFLGALIYADGPRGFAGPMMMCLLVQVMLPIYIALPLEFRMHKGLSSMPPPSRRSVELRKWRVTDFVSPLWIGLGMSVQALCVACAVAVYLYRPGTQGTFLAVFFSGALLLTMILTLFGTGSAIAPRADPFMSPEDTFRVRQRINRFLYVGNPVLSVWFTSTLLYNAGLLHVDLAYQFTIVSVIGQLTALALVSRWNRDLNTRDFSVYRGDGSAQVAR
jgi:hypothetical protein